jgi:hypothetical protein
MVPHDEANAAEPSIRTGNDAARRRRTSTIATTGRDGARRERLDVEPWRRVTP